MTTAPETRDFEEILRQTESRVRAYIAAMGISPADVDDLAQETYFQLHRNLEKMPSDVPPEFWVKGIAKNVCLNHLRKLARRGRLHRHALAEILSNTTTSLERMSSQNSLGAALADCVARLHKEQNRMLELRYTEELTSDQIAEKTRSTPEAVRVALHRIRAGLKDCITRRLAKRS